MIARPPGLSSRFSSRLRRTASALAGWLSPKPAQLRRFDAARINRLTSNWLATSASINEELKSDLDALRMRGRDLVKNNDYAKKFVGMVQNNVVGPDGFRLQVRIEDRPGVPDRLASAAIEAAWADWSKAADITGTQSLKDLCDTLVGGLPCDGEFLVRLVRGIDAGNKYQLAVQLIDVDRIDTQYNTTATTSGNGTANQIIMGVERDSYGRPVALWLFDAHPNDGARSGRTRTRVPMSEVIHRFKIDTASQARGIPWMAPGMLSLHHLGGFKLAALLAAEHGANHFGFFTSPEGVNPLGATDETGQTITTSQPGTFDTLPAGVSFTPFDSKYPSDNFGPFVKVTLQRIASGWRVAYHSLANDLEGVSFSSIRSGTLEERDRWAADQSWFISAFLEPLYQVWLQSALLTGSIVMPNGSALPAAKIAKFQQHEWQPRRWEWVDPKSDMEAKILSVRAGLIAPQDLAGQMGYDFEDTLAKIAAAQKLATGYGITLTAYEATPGAIQAGNQGGNQAATPATPAEPAAAKALADSQVQRQLDMLSAALLQLQGREQLAALPAPAAPQINVALDVTAAAMERAISVAAAPYFSQFEATARAVMDRDMPIIVNVPEAPPAQVTVNVAAPQVNFEATLPPATVIMNHPKTAVQVVERDANDEIIRTVTAYQD
jgi:lambda family phage portal protein